MHTTHSGVCGIAQFGAAGAIDGAFDGVCAIDGVSSTRVGTSNGSCYGAQGTGV